MSEINKDSVNYLTKSGNTYTLNQDIVLSDNSYFNLNNQTFDGNGHTITIDGVTGFSGVFHISYSDGIIKNLGILAINGSMLSSTGGGWVLANNSISNSSLSIQNCYSNGPIASYGGGICGNNCSNAIIIENCYSTGSIDTEAGGIVGSYFGHDNEGEGNITCKIINCFSTGAINGSKAGGITGRYLGSDNSNHVEIVNCYSTGDINGTSAGGISGSDTANRGTVLYSNCYSTGSFGSGSGINVGSIFSLSNVSNFGQIYLYNCYSIETPDVGNNVTSYSGNTYTVVDGILTNSSAGTTTNIYQVSGTPNQFTNNLSSIQGSSGVSLLNGNQTSTVWTIGISYPIHTYAVTLLLSYNYSLFPPPAVATLSQDTYYHTFYQVSQSNPKVMTSYTYDNTKTLIETVDISFGDYTISEVLQIMDNNPYVIGSNDRGTKFPMSIAYCDIYNEFLTSQKQKGVISGVNRQVVNDP